MQLKKDEQLRLRKRRIRAKITGTAKRPRLSVFRSLKDIYVQAIDDQNQKTIIGLSAKSIRAKSKKTKTDLAFLTGQKMAEKLLALKIQEVVFDRNGRRFFGRVKAVAEGARQAGLKF